MLDVMSQAKNAIEAYNTRLKAISSNVTNTAVIGYKRMEISFENVFNRLLRPGTSSVLGQNEGGTNPVQTGGTVAIANSSIDFSQGDLLGGGKLDAGIQGNGMFIISGDGGKNFQYTRNGEFQITGNKLLTKSGMQVYGFKRTGGVSSNQIEAIDLTGISYDPTQITFDGKGILRSSFNDKANPNTDPYGSEIPYQFAIVTFQNPAGLQYKDGTSFTETLASGQANTPLAPGDGNAGIIAPRTKEQSNIFYTSEIVDSLEIQRALSSSLTAIRLLNDSISQFINKLG